MVESYMAFGDWRSIADVTRALIQNAAMAVSGSHVVTHYDGRQADLGGTWKEISLYDAISEGVGEQVTDAYFDRRSQEDRYQAWNED